MNIGAVALWGDERNDGKVSAVVSSVAGHLGQLLNFSVRNDVEVGQRRTFGPSSAPIFHECAVPPARIERAHFRAHR